MLGVNRVRWRQAIWQVAPVRTMKPYKVLWGKQVAYRVIGLSLCIPCPEIFKLQPPTSGFPLPFSPLESRLVRKTNNVVGNRFRSSGFSPGAEEIPMVAF